MTNLERRIERARTNLDAAQKFAARNPSERILQQQNIAQLHAYIRRLETAKGRR